jgi:hypothetical protein
MWQNPEVALSLHRARVAEAQGRRLPRREHRVRAAAPGLALRAAAASGAR